MNDTIKDVSERLGIPASTIRYYETSAAPKAASVSSTKKRSNG